MLRRNRRRNRPTGRGIRLKKLNYEEQQSFRWLDNAPTQANKGERNCFYVKKYPDEEIEKIIQEIFEEQKAWKREEKRRKEERRRNPTQEDLIFKFMFPGLDKCLQKPNFFLE